RGARAAALADEREIPRLVLRARRRREPLEQLEEAVEIERLREDVGGEEAPATQRIGIRRDDDHREAGEATITHLLAPEGPAVHPRHHEVEEDDGRLDAPPQDAQSLLPIGGTDRCATETPEQLQHGMAQLLVVFDDQYWSALCPPHRGTVGSRSPAGSPAHRWGPSLPQSNRGERKKHAARTQDCREAGPAGREGLPHEASRLVPGAIMSWRAPPVLVVPRARCCHRRNLSAREARFRPSIVRARSTPRCLDSRRAPWVSHRGGTFCDRLASGRALGLHAGPEEMVARPDHARPRAVRGADRAQPGIGTRPVRLHAFLAAPCRDEPPLGSAASVFWSAAPFSCSPP